MRSRLSFAFLGYAAFSLLALLTLDGRFLAIVLILMAALALKTWLAAKRDGQS